MRTFAISTCLPTSGGVALITFCFVSFSFRNDLSLNCHTSTNQSSSRKSVHADIEPLASSATPQRIRTNVSLTSLLYRSSALKHVKEARPYATKLENFHNILPPLQRREQLGDLCQAYGLKYGLEIGVQTGAFTHSLLSRWSNFRRMYLIDPWEQQKNYIDHANVDNRVQNQILKNAKNLLLPFQTSGKELIFIRGYSNLEHSRFDNKSLDFIYLDARHDYCGTAEDLSLFWPKLSCGGIFSGHDYMTADETLGVRPKQRWDICADGSRHWGAVKAAVDEFAERVGAQLLVTYREPAFNSWFFRKDCK
mmetsp:Transcript_35092/g.59085  ORF Transcript_35092/g.59085 Transcript_35092/m.59085 type:complete len:308 (+) Transcript_35092:171-1094(+)